MSNDLKRDIELIKQYVPDENVRHIIFLNDDYKDDQFLCELDSIYKYFNSIMEIAFFFVYGRFKQWQNEGNNNGENFRYKEYVPQKGTRNFNRIVSVFEQLYRIKDLKPDNISDVLIDLQIDIANSLSAHAEDDDDLFQALNDFYLKYDVGITHSYNECDYLAKQYITSNYVDDPLRTGENNDSILHKRRDTLIELLRDTFPLFSNLSATIKPIAGLKQVVKNGFKKEGVDTTALKEIVFTYHNFGRSNERYVYELKEDIPLNFTIIASKNYYFYLERVDKSYIYKEKVCPATVLNYIRLSNYPATQAIYIIKEEDQISTLPENAYFIQDGTVANNVEGLFFNFERKAASATSVIRDFATINFKYIKKLSLAICDLISDNMKRELFKKYGSEHHELFNDLNNDGYLEDDEINSVDWDSSIAVLLVDESATMVVRTLLLKMNDNPRLFEDLCYNLEKRIGQHSFNAMRIIKKANQEFKIIKEKRIKYSRMDTIPTEIRMEFDKEDSFIRAEVLSHCLINELSQISGGKNNIVKQYTFPVSIIARLKMLESINSSPLPPAKKIDGLIALTNQTMIQLIAFYEGFFQYAFVKQNYKRSDATSEQALIHLQRDANKAFVDKFTQIHDDLNREGVTSKDIVKEIERLNFECSHPNNRDAQINIKYTYTKLFLGRRSFVDMSVFEKISDLSSISPEQFEDAVNLVKEMLVYLKTGIVNQLTKKGDETAIYPYIATHIYDHETRDGYIIKHFDVLFEDDSDRDIKILSEFNYPINHRYYCLPSSLRFNKNIDVWIEPILIDYNNFEVD